MKRRTGMSEMVSEFHDLRAGYQLGEESRFTSRLRGVDPMGSGADYHYAEADKFYRAIERAREFDRNNMIVGQGVDRLVDNVLQDGLTPDPETGNPEVNLYLYRRWCEWCRNPRLCDARKVLTFDRIAKLTLRSVIVDGDVVQLPLRDEGSLQAIEAHRLVTPYNTTKNVVHGVRVNEMTGAPEEYWIAPEAAANYRAVTKVKDVGKYAAFDSTTGEPNVFHVYNPKRFSQTRGVSAFLPVTYAIGIHDDLQFANLVKAQAAACVTMLIERDVNYGGGAIAQTGNRTEEENADGTTRTVESTHAGARLYGEVGEHLSGFTPNIPNPEFFEHASMILGIIAVNLNLPVAVLLLDPTKTNFSGWRGAIDQARLGFRNMQAWMRSSFHEPVYRWKVRQWLAEDRAFWSLVKTSKADPFGVKWKAPRWPYIEPMKDAQADSMRIEKRLTSPRRVAGDRGEDWDELVVEMVNDQAALFTLAMAKAQEINETFPEANLDWRELIHLAAPATASTGADAQAEIEPADAAQNEEVRKIG